MSSLLNLPAQVSGAPRSPIHHWFESAGSILPNASRDKSIVERMMHLAVKKECCSTCIAVSRAENYYLEWVAAWHAVQSVIKFSSESSPE